MNKLHSLFCGMMLVCSTSIMPSQPSSTPTRWIYAIAATADKYNLIKINASNENSENIYSIPKLSSKSFGDLLPADEIAAVNDFAKTNIESNFNLQAWLTRLVPISIESISVSPNSQMVIVNITYQSCVDAGMHFCFGASQINLVSATTKMLDWQWTRGFHSTKFLRLGCGISVFTNIKLFDIRWMSNSKAVVFSEYGDRCLDADHINIPIIIIPIDDVSKTFEVDEGVSWDISTDSRTLAVIARSCDTSTKCVDELYIDSIDVLAQKSSRTNYPIGPTALVDQRFFGVHHLGNSVVFSLYDTQREDCCGIALFSTNKNPHFTISQMDISARVVHTSVDGQIMALENVDDGSIWISRIVDNKVYTQRLLDGPIDFWQFGPDNLLLIRNHSEAHYSIVNVQGQILYTIDLSGIIKNAQAVTQENVTVQPTTPELVGW